MSFQLTDSQEAAYLALVLVAKEQAKPEADCIRGKYIETETDKLVENRGLTVEAASKAVIERCNGSMELKDIVCFQGGEIITVENILSNPSLYDGRPCADPLEPDEGTSRAMFFANDEKKNPLIHSFLHGKQIYYLRTNSHEVETPYNESATVPFEELLSLADILEPGDTEGVKELLELATEFDEIELQELQQRIKKSTGMTMGAMRAFVGRKKNSNTTDFDHLDLARKLIEQIGMQNILSVENGVFMWQDQGVWKMVEKGELQQKVQRIIEQEVRVMSSLVDGVTKVFTNEIYRTNHQFNVGNPEVINCRNGELHLSKKQRRWDLKTHDREAYRTSQIPVEYDPLADAPRFREFIKEIFANDADANTKAKALLEMIGYSMVAHCRYELFIILIGVGANGKSVVLSVLEALVGSENTVGVQPSQFDNRFQRAHLRHKLANIVTEIRQGEVIADAELKGIVSGEPSTVENKFKDPFTMRPYATCWFATNHMPHTRDFSEALFRRALIIKFNRVFTDKEKNPKLKDELIEELPGILNLVLDAYANAVSSDFTKPKSSEKAKEEWRLEADQVQQFILECCVKMPHEEAMVQTSKMYAGYRWWADENGIYKTLTQKTFRDRLTRMGFGSKRTNSGRHVTHVEMRTIFPAHCR